MVGCFEGVCNSVLKFDFKISYEVSLTLFPNRYVKATGLLCFSRQTICKGHQRCYHFFVILPKHAILKGFLWRFWCQKRKIKKLNPLSFIESFHPQKDQTFFFLVFCNELNLSLIFTPRMCFSRYRKEAKNWARWMSLDELNSMLQRL